MQYLLETFCFWSPKSNATIYKQTLHFNGKQTPFIKLIIVENVKIISRHKDYYVNYLMVVDSAKSFKKQTAIKNWVWTSFEISFVSFYKITEILLTSAK